MFGALCLLVGKAGGLVLPWSTIVALSAQCPTRNPQENIRQFMREA